MKVALSKILILLNNNDALLGSAIELGPDAFPALSLVSGLLALGADLAVEDGADGSRLVGSSFFGRCSCRNSSRGSSNRGSSWGSSWHSHGGCSRNRLERPNLGQNLNRCRVEGLGRDELDLLGQDLLLSESRLLNLNLGKVGWLKLNLLELNWLKLDLLNGHALLLLLNA